MQTWMGAAVALVGGVVSAGAEGFTETFDKIDDQVWHVAEYDFDHPMFDTDWRKAQVVTGPGGLTLAVVPHDGLNRFVGGSIRREEPTHYGRYEAVLQAAQGEGLVTGFFTYTGPHYGTRHDEIDIEILGRDTTRLHIAWFTDGVLHSHFVPLGFDAAEAPRRYAFDWQPDRITWFVEGRVVFTVTAAEAPLPQVPSRLFANLWAADATDPGMRAWSGRPAPETTGQAHVLEIQHIPAPAPDQLVQNVPLPTALYSGAIR